MGSCFGNFVSPTLLPQHLLHNYVAGLWAFYADLLCVWYAQYSLSIFHCLSSDISYAASIVHNLYTTPFLDILYVHFLKYSSCMISKPHTYTDYFYVGLPIHPYNVTVCYYEWSTARIYAIYRQGTSQSI